ncbi:MAG: hypothetical protein WCF94_00880 [bacterium]
MRESILAFTGKEKSREAFRAGAYDPVIEFVGTSDTQLNGLIMFVNEIVKNIWDHADGKGGLKMVELENGDISFEIWDDGQEAYDLKLIGKRRSRLVGNGINFGIGLEMIPDFAKCLSVSDFKMDASKGFRYSWVYKPTRRKT